MLIPLPVTSGIQSRRGARGTASPDFASHVPPFTNAREEAIPQSEPIRALRNSNGFPLALLQPSKNLPHSQLSIHFMQNAFLVEISRIERSKDADGAGRTLALSRAARAKNPVIFRCCRLRGADAECLIDRDLSVSLPVCLQLIFAERIPETFRHYSAKSLMRDFFFFLSNFVNFYYSYFSHPKSINPSRLPSFDREIFSRVVDKCPMPGIFRDERNSKLS